MSYTGFLPVGNKSIEIRFKCDECQSIVLSEEISIPSPNYEAEKASDSYNDSDGIAICENCQKNFTIWVYASYADGNVEVEDINDDDVIEIIVHPDELDDYYEEQIEAILSTPYYDFQFVDDIAKLKSLNAVELDDFELQKTLQQQIYSGVITCLEDYLSTTLIKQVLNNDENFKRFVRSFRNIKNRKFSLNTIYDQLEQIKPIVKKELLDVVYHDLRKVKGMYQDTLPINFPEIGELVKAIQIRHDMVHRNGKNKDGKKNQMSKQVVEDVISKVEIFVRMIDEQISQLMHQ